MSGRVRAFFSFVVLAAIGGALVWWAVDDVRQEDVRRAQRPPGPEPVASGEPPRTDPAQPGAESPSASAAPPIRRFGPRAAAPAPQGEPARLPPSHESFPDELRTSDDGRWLEVVPLFVPDAGVDDDTTVIWQDDSGLISIERSRKDREWKPLTPPVRGERPEETGRRLLADAEDALARGDFFEARRRASYARTFLPERHETYALLGKIAAAQNDVNEAKWNYERAEQYAGKKGLYANDVKKMARQAQEVGSLRRFETEHFAVACEWAPDEPNAILLREELERAWHFVARALDLRPAGKFPVVVYRHEEFYGRVSAAAWWAAGEFDGRVRISGSGVGLVAWRQVLIHELTHGFLSTQKAYVPGWLNEGLAQRVEYAASGAGEIGCRAGHGYLLAELPDSFGQFNNPRAARVAYLTAAHAVDRLAAVHGEAGLQRLVKAMASEPAGGYFTKALGLSQADFVKQFDAEYARPEGVPLEHPSFD